MGRIVGENIRIDFRGFSVFRDQPSAIPRGDEEVARCRFREGNRHHFRIAIAIVIDNACATNPYCEHTHLVEENTKLKE